MSMWWLASSSSSFHCGGVELTEVGITIMMTSSLLSYFQDTKWHHRTNTNLKKLVGKFGTEWAPKIISIRGVLCPEIRMTCLFSNQYQEVFHHRPGFEGELINPRKYFIVIKCQCFQVEGTRSELILFLTDTIYAGTFTFILTPNEYISNVIALRQFCTLYNQWLVLITSIMFPGPSLLPPSLSLAKAKFLNPSLRSSSGSLSMRSRILTGIIDKFLIPLWSLAM